MKNLDDLLKTKAAQAETDKKLKAQEEERTARENVEGSISSLETSKKQLSVVKESLSMEKEGRGKATRRKQSAESMIDSKVGDLEKFGISKEELLTSPDYSELEEVEEVKGANEEAEIFSSPSVENDALKAKLESLGIEVPSDASESDVESLISKRMESIDKELISKRLEIPGEKEKLVNEILEENNLLSDYKLDSLASYQRGQYNYNLIGSNVKTTLEELEPNLSRIAMLNEYPELKEAALEKLLTEVILRKERVKAEKTKAERDEYEKRISNRGGYNTSASQQYPQTDYERYEIQKGNLKQYEDQAAEQGISLEELMEKDESARRGVHYSRPDVESYERKVSEPGKKLAEYVATKNELQVAPRPEYGADSRSLGGQVEALTSATSKLINFPSTLEVEFDQNWSESSYSRGEVRFTIPSELEKRDRLYEDQRVVKEEIETLETNYRNLGSKPTGLFSGGAQKKWEADRGSLSSQIETKKSELKRLQTEAGNIDVSIGLGVVGKDVIEELKARPSITVGELKELLKEKAAEKQPKVAEAKALEGKVESLKERVQRLENESLKFESR